MSIWSWALLGAGSWIIAVALKILADFLVQRRAAFALKDWLAALLSGAWSSACELGLAAIAFLVWNASFADALVFALGAALAEFVILLPSAFSAHFGNKSPAAQAKRHWQSFYAERGALISNHLTARGLLWTGVLGSGGALAAFSAFTVFALVEGIQAYGQAKEWDWLDKRTITYFILFMLCTISAQIFALIYWH